MSVGQKFFEQMSRQRQILGHSLQRTKKAKNQEFGFFPEKRAQIQ
jgi:hypothetical protein